MNKKLKGFTLVELILVMAIFSILMAAIMSIITPLNKISKRASITEANAAAVDNIKTYIESSLRYAECVEICEGGLTDNTGKLFSEYSNEDRNKAFAVVGYSNTDSAITGNVSAEEAAVVNYLDNHYTNRVNSVDKNVDKYDPNKTPNPLTGNVRVLKIDNANGGKITETEYSFTAGYTFTQFKADGTKDTTLHRINSTVVKGNETDVINPAFLENYSFYIAPGYNQMVTVDVNNSNSDFDTKNDASGDYYAALQPVDSETSNFTGQLFSLSVVTYKNDTKTLDSGEVPAYRGVYNESETVQYPAFKSPFAITNTNMSLVNVYSEFAKDKLNTERFGPVRYNGTPKDSTTTYTPTVKVPSASGDWKYESITAEQAPMLFNRVYVHDTVAKDDNDDCIYFIYTLPDFV